MRYFKDVQNGYILAIGTGSGGTEITETEYLNIMSIIQEKPSRIQNIDYKLKEDLTWEQYDFIPDNSEEELDPQQALDIIFGGEGG